MLYKLVRRNVRGEHFFECPKELWLDALTAWDNDHSRACPMPVGHRMFTHPTEYNVSIVKTLDEKEITDTLKSIISSISF